MLSKGIVSVVILSSVECLDGFLNGDTYIYCIYINEFSVASHFSPLWLLDICLTFTEALKSRTGPLGGCSQRNEWKHAHRNTLRKGLLSVSLTFWEWFWDSSPEMLKCRLRQVASQNYNTFVYIYEKLCFHDFKVPKFPVYTSDPGLLQLLNW